MKILQIFNKPVLSWHPEDSCDVWITESGKAIDLGTESSHLGFINESLTGLDSTEQLINRGWIKLTNTRDSVYVRGLNRVLAEHKGVWMNPILAKAKQKNVTVNVSIVGIKEVELKLPKDQIKLLALI